MTRKEIAALACRILALYLFVRAGLHLVNVVHMPIAVAVGMLDNTFVMANLYSLLFAVGGLVVPAAAYITFGLLYWFKADALAARIVSEDPTPVASPALDRWGAMTIACVTVGLFLLVRSLGDLAAAIVAATADVEDVVLWRQRRDLWGSIVKALLSVWLIFGSRGIVRTIRKLRTAGQKSPNDGGPETLR